MIDKAMAPCKRLRMFLQNRTFKLNCKKIWFHEHCRKDFTRSKKSSNPVSCIFLPK